MKYQILFVVFVLAFATTVSANPLVEAQHIVKALFDDIMYLINHPTLDNAMKLVANYGWDSLKPYAAGAIRLQAHDMWAKG